MSLSHCWHRVESGSDSRAWSCCGFTGWLKRWLWDFSVPINHPVCVWDDKWTLTFEPSPVVEGRGGGEENEGKWRVNFAECVSPPNPPPTHLPLHSLPHIHPPILMRRSDPHLRGSSPARTPHLGGQSELSEAPRWVFDGAQKGVWEALTHSLPHWSHVYAAFSTNGERGGGVGGGGGDSSEAGGALRRRGGFWELLLFPPSQILSGDRCWLWLVLSLPLLRHGCFNTSTCGGGGGGGGAAGHLWERSLWSGVVEPRWAVKQLR